MSQLRHLTGAHPRVVARGAATCSRRYEGSAVVPRRRSQSGRSFPRERPRRLVGLVPVWLFGGGPPCHRSPSVGRQDRRGHRTSHMRGLGDSRSSKEFWTRPAFRRGSVIHLRNQLHASIDGFRHLRLHDFMGRRGDLSTPADRYMRHRGPAVGGSGVTRRTYG